METVIERARSFSRQKHAGQKLKFEDVEYASHPEAVAMRIADLLDTGVDEGLITLQERDQAIVAAYLHDTVEDSHDPIQVRADIIAEFGSDIAALVEELTNDEQEKQRLGKPRYLAGKIERMSKVARLVKLADREHNVQGLGNIHEDHTAFVEQYARDTRYILDHARFTPSMIELVLIESIERCIEPFL